MGQAQSAADIVLSAVTALLGFAVVIVLAYVCTKYIGGKMSLKTSGSKNVKIIEKIPLSADKQLIIVQSAGKTMLLGVTAQHIELISELDENLIFLNENFNASEQDFLSVLKKNIENNNLFSAVRKNKENTDEKQD